MEKLEIGNAIYFARVAAMTEKDFSRARFGHGQDRRVIAESPT